MQLTCDRTRSRRGRTSAPNYKRAGPGNTLEKQVVLMFFNCTVETFNQSTHFSSPSLQHFPTPPLRSRKGDISAGRASFVGRVKDTMMALRWTDFFLGGGLKPGRISSQPN